jgi:hypothetical protein
VLTGFETSETFVFKILKLMRYLIVFLMLSIFSCQQQSEAQWQKKLDETWNLVDVPYCVEARMADYEDVTSVTIVYHHTDQMGFHSWKSARGRLFKKDGTYRGFLMQDLDLRELPDTKCEKPPLYLYFDGSKTQIGTTLPELPDLPQQ